MFMDRPFGDLYETLRGIYFSDIFNLGGEILKIKSRLATFPKTLKFEFISMVWSTVKPQLLKPHPKIVTMKTLRHLCWGVNSNCCPTLGDGHQSYGRGSYTPYTPENYHDIGKFPIFH